jgi:trans-aconitate methyltransferase
MGIIEPKDQWASGAAYETYIGRWSRLVAEQFVRWLDLAPHSAWLDVGCGTGALSQVILAQADPRLLRGVDSSQHYLAHTRRRIQDARAAFIAGDAQALPLASAAFDGLVSGLALNFIPHPAQALREMVRAGRRGATLAAYVWDYAGQMQMLRYFWDAAAALDPRAAEADEGRRFPLCQPGPLRQLFLAADLKRVEVREMIVPTRFVGFADFWDPFLSGQGPAPGYVSTLSEQQKVDLRERLREDLPMQADGQILLQARAWAVRGEKVL